MTHRAIVIGDHHLKSSTFISWHTVDTRIDIVPATQGGWRINARLPHDRGLLENAGLLHTQLAIPLRDIVSTCARLTGCESRLRRGRRTYTIDGTPLIIRRDGSYWAVALRGNLSSSMMWNLVHKSVREHRYATRRQLLEAVVDAIAEHAGWLGDTELPPSLMPEQ